MTPIKMSVGDGGIKLSLGEFYPYSENDTPEDIAVKMKLHYPDLDFNCKVYKNTLEVNATLGVLDQIDKTVMYHYIPNKCKAYVKMGYIEGNTGKYTYNF